MGLKQIEYVGLNLGQISSTFPQHQVRHLPLEILHVLLIRRPHTIPHFKRSHSSLLIRHTTASAILNTLSSNFYEVRLPVLQENCSWQQVDLTSTNPCALILSQLIYQPNVINLAQLKKVLSLTSFVFYLFYPSQLLADLLCKSHIARLVNAF